MAEEKFQIFDLAEHARKKGMWAGTLTKATISDLAGMYIRLNEVWSIESINRDHTPALLKIFDEIIVNATDHERDCRTGNKKKLRVSYINVLFDTNGAFSCENDGPGIPIVVHAKATKDAGRPVYVPEVAFCYFLAGSNLEKPTNCVKGGINGIGAKLANVHSELFTLETVDNNIIYTQSCSNRLRIIHPPSITKTKVKSHTKVAFIPAYCNLGYGVRPEGQDYEDISAWLFLRTCLAAAYVGPKVKVSFNGITCITNNASEIAKAYLAGNDITAIVMDSEMKSSDSLQKLHPWDVAIALSPFIKKFKHLSVLNGVVTSKGVHLTHIKRILNDATMDKLQKLTKDKERKITTKDSCSHMLIVVIGALPGADWTGQRKDELQISETKLKNYQFPNTFINKVGSAIADHLLVLTNGKKPRKTHIEIEKYTRAKKAGTKDSNKCMLLVGEGDSAIALLRAGLTLGNPGGPSYDICGTFSLGGVIMNAMRKVNEVETTSGEMVIVRNEQLTNNKVLKSLVDILGLDFSCNYELPDDRAKLNYGGIMACVDQDLDGCGKILGLLLVWFHLFWPNLIKYGFVKRFLTPVVRIYPKKEGMPPVAEFSYEVEAKKWIDDNGGNEVVLQNYEVRFYKGLATHATKEVPRMFNNFLSSVYTFTLDDSAHKLFDVYFGSRPSLRKLELSSSVKYLTCKETQELQRTQCIPCSTHLSIDTKAYKLDAIERQIPSFLDGLTRARRKVTAGALRCFGNDNRERKVFQFSGYVAEHMFYHHGDASLNSTIIGVAQNFPGAYLYPTLIGIGQFGTRHQGGKDHGSPRYISVKLNNKLIPKLYPQVDTCLLDHVIEDGERAEPKYFVPVLPMAILESGLNPSEGWRYTCWARNFDQVVKIVRAYIDINDVNHHLLHQPTSIEFYKQFPLDPECKNYKGEIRQYRGEPYSFGWYDYDALTNTINVTELPLRVPTQSFIDSLKKASRGIQYIKSVDDYSTTEQINIFIHLHTEAYQIILEKYGDVDIDPIEDFLLLRCSLRAHLNYVKPEGGVIEFGQDYHKVILQWLPIRRDLYAARLYREEALLELRILMETEILRYVLHAAELNLAQQPTEKTASKVLSNENYPLIDSKLLQSPGFEKTSDIRQKVLYGNNCNHNYILDLRERDLIMSAYQNRDKKITEMKDQLSKVQTLLTEQPFAGASVWLNEINSVIKVISPGLS
jgi:DNA topoisomerase-2